jgi:hypothetical protein
MVAARRRPEGAVHEARLGEQGGYSWEERSEDSCISVKK